MDGVLWKAISTEVAADLVRQSSTQATISIHDVALNPAWQTLLQRGLRFCNQLVVKTSVETVVLLADIVGCNSRTERMSRGENQ